jgi:chemotaxis methyl-accepting protein methylase
MNITLSYGTKAAISDDPLVRERVEGSVRFLQSKVAKRLVFTLSKTDLIRARSISLYMASRLDLEVAPILAQTIREHFSYLCSR